MAVPTGGDITIYDSPVKKGEARVAVGLDYPALTGQFQDLFGSGSEPNIRDWWFTQLGGSVLVSGGDMLIRSHGGPSYELVRSREHLFPADPDQPFELIVNMTFPQTDPKYTPVVTLGSLQQTQGADAFEPLQIHHIGEVGATLGWGDANIDRIKLIGVGGEQYEIATNDHFDYQFIVQWDPLLAVNPNKLTVKVEGVTRYTSDVAAAPRYLAFGWDWSTVTDPDADGAAIAAISGTATLIQVHDVTVQQLGAQGYETRTHPAWTSANAGGTTLDNAAEGERVSIDGETWAIVPTKQVKTVEVSKSRSGMAGTFRVVCFVQEQPEASNGDVFDASDRYLRRPLLIDTRVSDESNTTSWRRQIAGRVTRVEWGESDGRATVTLSGRCRVMDGLDVFLSRTYTGSDAGEVEAVNTGYDFDTILQDLADVADKVDGGPLGARDLDITAPDIVPSYLSSGGESLLPVMLAVCDQLAQECWVEYETSGTGRYGLLHINAWTLGSGSAGYTFDGSQLKEARLVEDSEEGPGQVNYRQNLPVINGNTLVNTFFIPSAGTFPTFPYPAKSRILSDSIAWAKSVQATSIQSLTDKDGNTIAGGVAMHRWRMDNVRRRAYTFECSEHDWMEPGDEIGLDVRGSLSGETWVIDGYTLRVEDGVMSASVTVFTSAWFDAVTRAGG